MPGWQSSCRAIFMSTTFPAPRDPGRDPEHPLARAFASFTEAAGSLERTYGQLQGQVAQLRQELEVTNRDLRPVWKRTTASANACAAFSKACRAAFW